VTANAERSRTYLKRRLLDLGLSANLNSFQLGAGVGIRGTLQLQTKNDWQNVRNVKIAEAEEAVEAPAAPAAKRAPVGTKPNPFGAKK
jgi:hypothetical protein